MNAKRQTIWLVSMLSLMVVLSAYYLFTENSAQVDLTTAGGSVNSAAGTPVALDMKDPNGAKVDGKDAAKVEVKPDPNQQTAQAGANPTDANSTDAKAADKAASGQTAAQADKAGQAKSDAKVLDKMTSAALSGSDYFADQQLKRDEEISKQTEALMTITANSKESTQNLEKAYNDLDKLQNMNTKMLNLESQLTKQFPNAVVTKDGEKYKVAVQAQKLTASQAVSIVDLSMQEMNIGQDKVIVQYLP